MPSLLALVAALELRSRSPFPEGDVLPPAPAVRQIVLDGDRDALAKTPPREPPDARARRSALALLKDRRETQTAIEPVPIETLLALAPAEAFQLRQLFALRPMLAVGDDEAWDRVDRAILAQRGLEAASVVAGRTRSALFVRDSALVPRMVEATREVAHREAARTWLIRHADLAAAWALREALSNPRGAHPHSSSVRALALLAWLHHDAPERTTMAFTRIPDAIRDRVLALFDVPYVPGLLPCAPPTLPDVVEEARRGSRTRGNVLPHELVVRRECATSEDLAALGRTTRTLDGTQLELVFRTLFADVAFGDDALGAALHDDLLPASRVALARGLVGVYRACTPKESAAFESPLFASLAILARSSESDAADTDAQADPSSADPASSARSSASAAGVLGRLYRALRAKKDPRAGNVLDALGALADEHAVFELGRVLDDERIASTRAHARRLLEPIAASHAMSVDELVLRTLPPLDLDAHGIRRLEDGSELALLPSLEVVLRGRDGTSLPPPATTLPPSPSEGTKRPRAAKPAAIHDDERRELSEDVRALASRIARRFERWMADAQPLSSEMLAPFVAHPVALRVASMLVWEELDEAGAALARFRIAEDGSAATIDDDSRPFPRGRVRIAHPVTIPADELLRWTDLFGSYEILQPFAQLARRHHAEALAANAPKTREARQAAAKVHVLLGRGFHIEAGGSELRKTLSDGASIVVELSPPFDVRSDARHQGELTFDVRAETATGARANLGALPLAVQSELAEFFPPPR